MAFINWKRTDQEPPSGGGWYFVCVDIGQAVFVRTLLTQRSPEGDIAESRWDIAELTLNEPLETYRYWTPLIFPSPPPFLPIPAASQLFIEALEKQNQLIDLLDDTAYSGEEVVDIKVGCNIGRVMEMAIRVRDLLVTQAIAQEADQ